MIDLGYAIDVHNHLMIVVHQDYLLNVSDSQRITPDPSMNLSHFDGQAALFRGLDKVAAQKLFRRQEQ